MDSLRKEIFFLIQFDAAMKNIVLFIMATVAFRNLSAQSKNPVDYVDPFIGTSNNVELAGSISGMGKTFPGATTPFGLVQLSPNTITGGDCAAGYSYEHNSIEGFAFTHMSGTGWYGDLGNFLVMPTIGPLKTNSGKEQTNIKGYRSKYDKKSETARVAYYSVQLTDYNIKAEMTAAPHSGILRFTFPKNKQSRIQIDLARRIGGTSVLQYVKRLDDHTIQGWMKCTPEGGGWGHGGGQPNYTVYFYAKFSKPFKDYGVWTVPIAEGTNRKKGFIEDDNFQTLTASATILKGCKEMQGKHLGFFVNFNTKENEPILLKTGISLVNMEGAQQNLAAEISDWDFEKVQKNATSLWTNALSKLLVKGGTEDQKTIFYTALYHTMVDPRSLSDVNGNYPGGDGNIHQTKKFTKRSIFSGFDVFRSQFPLQTIINPQMVNDMVNSLVELADENDSQFLEAWEFLNAYIQRKTVDGAVDMFAAELEGPFFYLSNPALSVLADAYAKGIRNYNIPKAYEYARNSVEKVGNGERGYSSGISNTLEFAYYDWCLAQLAKQLGKSADAIKYLKRSHNYRNIFDSTVGWFRPRKKDGSWQPWPERGRLTQDYAGDESNPYQQGWLVPHDIKGLAELLGGKEKTIADLTDFFEKQPEGAMWNDYYNHANEFVHHVAFIFNRLGAPWLTQKWARQICERKYNSSPVKGLIGNDDMGQMSAWYVLAASGFHPECPGDTRYELCSPLFSEVVIQLDPVYTKGGRFRIVANNNSSKNRYIQSAKLNGKPYNKCWISHEAIASGGELEMVMGEKPNLNWGLE